MPFKGTNKRAYKAAAKGKTSQERSRLYYKEKMKDEKNKKGKSSKARRTHIYNTNDYYFTPPKRKSTASKKQKYISKKTILDRITNHRNCDEVVNIANGISTYIVKRFGKELDSVQKDRLRSTITFVLSEVVSARFEEQIDFYEKIKLYIKYGEKIYKLACWIDEKTGMLKTNDNDIREVRWYDKKDYNKFLMQHKKVKEYYKMQDVVIKIDKCNLQYIDELTKVYFVEGCNVGDDVVVRFRIVINERVINWCKKNKSQINILEPTELIEMIKTN